MGIELKYVHYMPQKLLPNVLYVSTKFRTAAHLCACGCGNKVRTPLTPTEWRLSVSKLGPSLEPSIGSWQLECRSHYWIQEGEVVWSNQWTDTQVVLGRICEDAQRQAYYRNTPEAPLSLWAKIWGWLKNLWSGR